MTAGDFDRLITGTFFNQKNYVFNELFRNALIRILALAFMRRRDHLKMIFLLRFFCPPNTRFLTNDCVDLKLTQLVQLIKYSRAQEIALRKYPANAKMKICP